MEFLKKHSHRRNPKGNIIYSGIYKKRGFIFGFFQNCYCELWKDGNTLFCYTKKSKAAQFYDSEFIITNKTQISLEENPKQSIIRLTNKEISPQDQFTEVIQSELILSADTLDELSAFASAIKLFLPPDQPHEKESVDSFEIVSVIGRGFYGKVMLVNKKDTNEIYAMKTIKKNKIFIKKKINLIWTERNILVKVNHPFIVKLHSTFQTDSKFYFIMEYIPGGELFKYLRECDVLPHDEAALYLAEIGMALSYLHSIGIVYRDLKPENILCNTDGHLKITDFGLSKIIAFDEQSSDAKTFCGTYEYMAPEIVSIGSQSSTQRLEQKNQQPNNIYGYEVDWWAYGVLAYEMLYGTTPFYNVNSMRMMHDIVNSKVPFPFEATPDEIDFINRFLNKDPKQRATFDSMKEHAFWKGMNFDDVLQKKIQPQYIPIVTTRESTSNFDEEFTLEPPLDSVGSLSVIDNPVVPGFSYTRDNVIDSE